MCQFPPQQNIPSHRNSWGEKLHARTSYTDRWEIIKSSINTKWLLFGILSQDGITPDPFSLYATLSAAVDAVDIVVVRRRRPLCVWDFVTIQYYMCIKRTCVFGKRARRPYCVVCVVVYVSHISVSIYKVEIYYLETKLPHRCISYSDGSLSESWLTHTDPFALHNTSIWNVWNWCMGVSEQRGTELSLTSHCVRACECVLCAHMHLIAAAILIETWENFTSFKNYWLDDCSLFTPSSSACAMPCHLPLPSVCLPFQLFISVVFLFTFLCFSFSFRRRLLFFRTDHMEA